MKTITIDLSKLAKGEDGNVELKAGSENPELGAIATTFQDGVQDAVMGGAYALLVTELADGFLPQINIGTDLVSNKALVKFGAAWAVRQWRPGFISADTARIASMFLAFDGVRDIVPLDATIRDLLQRFKRDGSGSGSSGSEGAAASESSHNSHSPVLTRLGITNV